MLIAEKLALRLFVMYCTFVKEEIKHENIYSCVVKDNFISKYIMKKKRSRKKHHVD